MSAGVAGADGLVGAFDSSEEAELPTGTGEGDAAGGVAGAAIGPEEADRHHGRDVDLDRAGGAGDGSEVDHVRGR